MCPDNYVAFLVLDVLAKAVHTAYCLEQCMVFNIIINVEDCSTWGIKSCEQLVYNNE